jgi:hypothetical protein
MRIDLRETQCSSGYLWHWLRSHLTTWSERYSLRYSVAVVIPASSVSRKAGTGTCKTSCGVQSSAVGSIALHQSLEWLRRYRCASAIPLFPALPRSFPLDAFRLTRPRAYLLIVTLSVHPVDIVIGR